MHKCLKCGRPVANVDEITEGCPCGSKVFIFHRLPSAGEETVPEPNAVVLTPNRAVPDDGIAAIDIASATGENRPEAITSPPAGGKSEPAPSSSPYNPFGAEPDSQTKPTKLQEDLSNITSTFPPSGENSAKASPAAVASSFIDSETEEEIEPDDGYSQVWMTKGGRIEPLPAGNSPITSALDTSATAASAAEVANVRQLKRGVYEIDFGRLQGEPLVVQDSMGIYYVRLPFTPLGEKSPGESVGTPAPKNKIE